jgi:hypothetical protein
LARIFQGSWLPHFAALGMDVEQARISARNNSLACQVCAANHLN